MTNDLKTINTNEETEYKGGLLEKIRNSRKKALTRIVAASSLLGSPNVATVAGGTGLALFSTMLTSCSDEPDNPLPEKDTTRPRIEIKRPEVDISGGKKISINGNRLYIGDLLTAERSDNVTSNCKVELFFNNDPITSGTTINKEGLLTIIVTDNAGNSETSSIKLSFKEQLVSGLENINNLSMKVNEEIDLLKGVQISDNLIATITIETDGKKINVSDPHHYIPEFPGTCIIYVDIKDINGNHIDSFTSNVLNIAPLEYHEPTFNTVDIHENYPWFFNITNSALKETIRPQITLSILACNLYNPSKISLILMGETSEYVSENILGEYSPSTHGNDGAGRMKRMCPNANILGCNTIYWNELKEYIENRPEDELFIISAAGKFGGSQNPEYFENSTNVKAAKDMLETGRIILVTASDNISNVDDFGGNIREVDNEDIQNGKYYNLSSVNSRDKNGNPRYNKFTVTGYIPGRENYYSPTSTVGAITSLRPVGYGIEKGNIVMPSSGVVTLLGTQDLSSTDSSYPTAIISSSIYNSISTIMAYSDNSNNINSATKNMASNYLISEPIKDKENGNITESGDYQYFIDANKIIKNVVLNLPEIENIHFNFNEPVQLPNNERQCYVGKGFMFEYNGTLYESNEENISILKEAITQGKITKQIFNPHLFKQYGGGNSVHIKTFILDKRGKIIPGTEYECNNTISNSNYIYNAPSNTGFKYNYSMPTLKNNYIDESKGGYIYYNQ